jgi:hypothetical protein
VFFCETAKLRILGHQVFLDLLLLHHHRLLLFGWKLLTLGPP